MTGVIYCNELTTGSIPCRVLSRYAACTGHIHVHCPFAWIALRAENRLIRENLKPASRLCYDKYILFAGSKKEAVKQYRKVADELAEAGFMIRAIAVSKKVMKLDPSQTDLHEKLANLNQEQSGGGLPLQAPEFRVTSPCMLSLKAEDM